MHKDHAKKIPISPRKTINTMLIKFSPKFPFKFEFAFILLNLVSANVLSDEVSKSITLLVQAPPSRPCSYPDTVMQHGHDDFD